MSRKKELEKKLFLIEKEFKIAFDYISKETLDLNEFEEYMNPFINELHKINKELEELK